MRRSVKKLVIVLFLAMMFTSAISTSVTVYARSVNYQQREAKAKRNLVKKVKKYLSWAYKPSCRIVSSSRKGRNLTCTLTGSIGGGACQGKVRVDLKTGNVKVLSSIGMFDNSGVTSFRISVR